MAQCPWRRGKPRQRQDNESSRARRAPRMTYHNGPRQQQRCSLVFPRAAGESCGNHTTAPIVAALRIGCSASATSQAADGGRRSGCRGRSTTRRGARGADGGGSSSPHTPPTKRATAKRWRRQNTALEKSNSVRTTAQTTRQKPRRITTTVRGKGTVIVGNSSGPAALDGWHLGEAAGAVPREVQQNQNSVKTTT